VVHEALEQIISESEHNKEDLHKFSSEQFQKLQSRLEMFNSIIAEEKENLQESARVSVQDFDQKVNEIESAIENAFVKISEESLNEKNKISEFIGFEIEKIRNYVNKFQNDLSGKKDLFAEQSESFELKFQEMMENVKESISQSIDEIESYSEQHKSNLSEYIHAEVIKISEQIETLDGQYQSHLHAIEQKTLEGSDVLNNRKELLDNYYNSQMEDLEKKTREQSDILSQKKEVLDNYYHLQIEELKKRTQDGSELLDKKIEVLNKQHRLQMEDLERKALEGADLLNQTKKGLDTQYHFHIEELEKKTREGSELLDEKKEILEASIQYAIDTVFAENEQKKLEFIRSAETELENFQIKMKSIQSIYDENLKNIHDHSSAARNEVNNLISELNNTIENSMSRFEDLSAEEMETLQDQISQAINSVQQRAEEVFEQSYEQFASDVKEFRNEFTQVQEKLETLEYTSNEKYHELAGSISELKSHFSEELTGYIQQIKKSAADLSEMFDKDMNGKVLKITKEIESLEGDIAKLRTVSVEEIEDKISPLYTKLGNIETNLLESQKHLLSKWSDETSQVMKKIQEKEIVFAQSAEKWETQFQNMERTAKESVHKGYVELEKKRTDLLESFDSTMQTKISEIEKLSETWTEENEKTLNDLLATFKLKMQEKEDSAFEKMQQMSQRFTEIRKDVQTKHDSVIDLLQNEKSILEKEMKGLADKQLQLFNMEMDSRIEKNSDEMKTASEAMLNKIEKDIFNLRTEFIEMEESTRESITVFTQEKKDLFVKLDKETKQTAKEIMVVQEAFHKLKDEMKAIDRAEKSAEKVNKIVHLLESKLNQAEEKAADIQEVYRRVDELKEVRLKLDSELMMLAQKREKVDKLEDQLQLILNLRDEIEEKGENLEEVKNKIEDILRAQGSVDSYRVKLDGILEEFVSQHALIENVIESITAHQKTVEDVSGRVTTVASSIESIDEKTKNLKDQMISMEAKLEALKKHENEIEDVKAKFLEIEDLIADIENRKKQIETLRKRFEELRISMSDSVLNIEKIEHDAESKVRQLTDLINASEYTEKITSRGSDKSSSKSAGSDKRNMIQRLGQMGWSADEIAAKINMDVSSIETILSTYDHQP
jgi:DNA repair exonuclease SbcCD ATPase subunit